MRPPNLGGHTVELLGEAGIGANKVKALQSEVLCK